MVGTASREAFVTLATNDTYSLGCLVLGSSLRKVGTVRKLVVMVSKDVSLAMRSQLLGVFDFVMDVNVLDSQDPKNLALLGRPDLNVTFTKFHCWRLTQFDKCVFLDADTLVLQNVDELFDREELSAAPDAGWPDCFNSGVFVFKPSQETYDALLKYATTQGSFDGGDQGLLNMYFGDWATKDISKHLPFIYNVVSQAFYSYLPAFTQFKDTVKIVHFIGAVKPWHHTYNTSSRTVTPLPGTGHSQEFLQVWWNLFMSMVQPKLDPSLNVAELTQTLLYDLSRDIDDSPDRVPKETPRFIERYPSKTSVQSVYPYKLPDDVELFYDTKEDNPSDNPGHDRSAKDILDLPVEQREYTELESHYSEEPLSHINPDQPPGSAYDAKHISEGWEKDNFPPQHNDENSAGNSEKEEIETVINETEDKTNVTDRDEMGLCGDLAALDIQNQSWSVGKVDLSDAERKLNWEKGQIDYLGQDSFDNIQKKIQSSLDTHKEAVPVTKTSPFTPVQAPTPVLVKAPAPTPAPSQAVVKAPPSAVVKVPEPTPAPALTPVQATSQVNAPAPTPKQAPAPTPKQAPAPTPVQATSQAKVPAVGRVRPQKTAVPTAAPTAAPKAAPAAAPTAAPVKVQSTATVTPAQVKVQSTAKAPVTAQATAAAKAPAPTPEPSKEPAPKKTVMSITTTSKKK